MDRAGRYASPLSRDELTTIFEIVARGGDQAEARKQLPGRDRSTVSRAYNVAAQFQQRGIERLDDQIATRVAEAARYSTTPH